MLTIKNPQAKTEVIQRLARAEGQLRGVQKMIAEDRDCKDIVQQLIAIRSALKSASLRFMQEVAQECMLKPEEQAAATDQAAVMADLIQMLGKLSE